MLLFLIQVFVVDLGLNVVFVCDFDGKHKTHFGSRFLSF